MLPVLGVTPLLPPSDVLVGIHNNTTAILAMFPLEKSTVPRLPKITHAVYQATRLKAHLVLE